MFTVIGIMVLGTGLGYMCRKVSFLQRLNPAILITICVLLFVLGLSIGANEMIMNNLTTLGLQALVLSCAGTFGSILAGWAVYHFFFKTKE
jgi:uncharacterized membrane protein YbjE (DUF340 family)